MRKIGRMLLMLALAAFGLSGAAALAQQQNMTLPDVTVTAPGNIPPSTAASNPYFGQTRVEEGNWLLDPLLVVADRRHRRG